MRYESCSIIAGPPMCFAWGVDEEDERCAALKLLLLQHISYRQANGAISFSVPVDAGIGLYSSEILLSLKAENDAIQLLAFLPFEEQAVKWSPELMRKYTDNTPKK